MIDLKVRATGDLHVDFHHTTEDTAIVIGQAVKQALGDFSGITRFGRALIPMDEALTRVALDVSNRPYLIWKVTIPKPKLGEMDTELFKEWFQAFAQNAGVCLHIENLYADNSHHIVETCFKGTGARACARRSRRTSGWMAQARRAKAASDAAFAFWMLASIREVRSRPPSTPPRCPAPPRSRRRADPGPSASLPRR